MDQDIAQKKKVRQSSSPSRLNQSKFFHTLSESKTSGVQRRHSDGLIAAGSSKLEDKENVYVVVDDDDEVAETSEPDLDGSDLSLKAQCDHDTDMDLHVDEFPDVVEQEDGYISPTPSCSNDLQDLSSPLRSGQTPDHRKWKSDQRLLVYDLDEEDIEQARANATQTAVMNGWRERWALTSKTKKIPTEDGETNSISHGSMVLNIPGSGSSRIANLKRSNTNVTPRGRHALSSANRHPFGNGEKRMPHIERDRYL